MVQYTTYLPLILRFIVQTLIYEVFFVTDNFNSSKPRLHNRQFLQNLSCQKPFLYLGILFNN